MSICAVAGTTVTTAYFWSFFLSSVAFNTEDKFKFFLVSLSDCLDQVSRLPQSSSNFGGRQGVDRGGRHGIPLSPLERHKIIIENQV